MAHGRTDTVFLTFVLFEISGEFGSNWEQNSLVKIDWFPIRTGFSDKCDDYVLQAGGFANVFPRFHGVFEWIGDGGILFGFDDDPATVISFSEDFENR